MIIRLGQGGILNSPLSSSHLCSRPNGSPLRSLSALAQRRGPDKNIRQDHAALRSVYSWFSLSARPFRYWVYSRRNFGNQDAARMRISRSTLSNGMWLVRIKS